MSRNHGIGAGLTMLGGAAVGAALMYLMDPENGPARRHHAREVANDALAKAGTSLGAAGATAAHSLHEATNAAAHSAGSLWSTLADKARDLASSLSSHAHHASNTAAETGSSAMDSAREAVANLTSHARSTASDAYDRARSRIGFHDESTSHAAPIAISVTTAGLLGLAAWYFLDSKHGKARRERVYNMANDVVQGTCDMARKAGASLSGRSGEPHMEYAFSEDYVDEMPAVAESDLAPAAPAPAAPPTKVL